MKKLLLVLLIALSCFSLDAQSTKGTKLDLSKKRYSRKVLMNEIVRQRAELDSLARVLDTLRMQREQDRILVSNLSPVVDVSSDAAINPGSENIDEEGQGVESFTTDVPDEVLIARLENMNTTVDLPYNETVKKYMILYSERYATEMCRVMGDAKYYFPIFEEAFKRYDMPEELKYMSIIESFLKPRATSRAGAKGLWQFMSGTAKVFGMRINNYVDERMDTEKAADAAARYLLEAYNIFGDWSLAISSYNCGAGNVNRAIKMAGGRTDFWSIYPYLPRETRGYVPAFVGAMYAFKYHREYGINPDSNPMPDQIDTIEIHRRLHFRQINELVGVPMGTIELLNTQYTRQIIPGDGDYLLRLPHKWALRFAKFNDESLYEWRENELFSRVRVSTTPTTSPSSSYSSRSNGSSKGYHHSSKGKGKGKYYKGGSGSSQKPASHTVKSGDNLSKIAAKNGVSVEQLRKANGIKGNTIKPGQKINIPGKKSAAPAKKSSGHKKKR